MLNFSEKKRDEVFYHEQIKTAATFLLIGRYRDKKFATKELSKESIRDYQAEIDFFLQHWYYHETDLNAPCRRAYRSSWLFWQVEKYSMRDFANDLLTELQSRGDVSGGARGRAIQALGNYLAVKNTYGTQLGS